MRTFRSAAEGRDRPMRYEEMDARQRSEAEEGISEAFLISGERLWDEIRDAAIHGEIDRESISEKVRTADALAALEDMYRFNNVTAAELMSAVGPVSAADLGDPATYEPAIGSLAAECASCPAPDKEDVAAAIAHTRARLPLSPDAREIKTALEGGHDLYNVVTGEFCFLWNDLGSIATLTVPLDDPQLIEAVTSPDFNFYEDIVGYPNKTAHIIESNESRLQDGEQLPDPRNPDFDERHEDFNRMAMEEGWGDAGPERISAAMRQAGYLCDVEELLQSDISAARACEAESRGDRSCSLAER